MARSAEELDLLWRQTCVTIFRSSFKLYRGFLLSANFSKIQEEIENFEVYDDDIWVTSYPKCGTTWTQEMVWCIVNDMNLEGSKVDMDLRFPFIEFSHLIESTEKLNIPMNELIENSVAFTKKLKRPRFIKTHLPWVLLPKQIQNFEKRPKIFHVTRSAKDACLSFYHHSLIFEAYTGDLDLFVELFINNKISWTPFFRNVQSYWNVRHDANIKFIKYEDMKEDLRSVVTDVAVYLNKTLSQGQMNKLLDHLSFESMKNNNALNKSIQIDLYNKHNFTINKDGRFFRSGIVGGHKAEMSPAAIKMLDEWTERELKITGLPFYN